MLKKEEQHVPLRLRGETHLLLHLLPDPLPLPPEILLGIDEALHVALGLELDDAAPGGLFPLPPAAPRAALDEGRVRIDEIVEREAAIDEILHGLAAELIHVLADLGAVVGHGIHHLAVRLREPVVVLEEVAMSVDVGDDDLLIDQVVALQEVGVAGVVVDHHLVDLLETVGVPLGELIVLHAEAPVGVARRKPAVGRHLVQLVEVEDLEDRLVEVEAVLARITLHFDLNASDFGCYAHLPLPRNSLMESMIPSRSGMSEVMTRSSSPKTLSRSFLNCPDP